jgi:hypothetical protein
MEDSSFSKLVLLLTLCVLLERTEALPFGGGAEDHNSRIRGLWRLQMKETKSKEKGEGRSHSLYTFELEVHGYHREYSLTRTIVNIIFQMLLKYTIYFTTYMLSTYRQIQMA